MFDIDRTDETPNGGRFILNALQLVTDKHLADAMTVRDFLRTSFESLTGGVDMTKSVSQLLSQTSLSNCQRRQALSEIRKVLSTASGVSAELSTMRWNATETSKFLASLVNNDEHRDLQVDPGGQTRELCSRHLEICLTEYLIKASQTTATIEQVEVLLDSLFNRATQLGEEEEVAAGMFTEAIASITLLPTFIVGLYGQYFVDVPETDWRFDYFFSWGTIVLVTIGQVLFFTKRYRI